MNSLQKMGGVAALVMAATFVVGFAVFLGVLTPAGYFDDDIAPAKKVAILADNQAIVSTGYLTSFVAFGIFLVVLALALYERLKVGAPAMARTATAIGLVWAGLVIASGMVANVGIDRVVGLYGNDPAEAGSAWLAIETVQLGLGGGNEIAGGVWVLLIGWAALRARELPRALNYLGVVIGVSGLLTVVPALEVPGAVEVLGLVFGLGLIVWFVWLGIVMLRRSSTRTPDAG
ncbi:MAG: DUF4386 domain-containing protein [Chloroflexi bacterium]|nr:DUF4386 domain-containing protein [Chloroflexota bacterium]